MTDACPTGKRAIRPASVQKRRQQRKRISRACDFCKVKKRKCDGRTPCTPCRSAGGLCTYETKRSRDAKHQLLRMRQLLDQGVQILYQACIARQGFPGRLPAATEGEISTISILESLGIMNPTADDIEYESSLPRSHTGRPPLPSPESDPTNSHSAASVADLEESDCDDDGSSVTSHISTVLLSSPQRRPSIPLTPTSKLSAGSDTFPKMKSEKDGKAGKPRNSVFSPTSPPTQKSNQSKAKSGQSKRSVSQATCEEAFSATGDLHPLQLQPGFPRDFSFTGPFQAPSLTIDTRPPSGLCITRPNSLFPRYTAAAPFHYPTTFTNPTPPPSASQQLLLPNLDVASSQWQSLFDFNQFPGDESMKMMMPQPTPASLWDGELERSSWFDHQGVQ